MHTPCGDDAVVLLKKAERLFEQLFSSLLQSLSSLLSSRNALVRVSVLFCGVFLGRTYFTTGNQNTIAGRLLLPVHTAPVPSPIKNWVQLIHRVVTPTPPQVVVSFRHFLEGHIAFSLLRAPPEEKNKEEKSWSASTAQPRRTTFRG